MKITINGKEIEARQGQSVLDAALDRGTFIPHLRSHPDLKAKGGCRLYSMEIEGGGQAVPTCKTEAREGVKITINEVKAEKARRTAMELILIAHPADCTGCPKYGKCELQSVYQYMRASPERRRKKPRSPTNNDSNPLISHLFTRCVRCGRCIRVCRELRGVEVLDYVRTDVGICAGVPDGESLKEAGCCFCGACTEVCPTGSIMDQVRIMKEDRSYAENIVPCKSTCPVHIDIPRYVRYIKDGEFDKAAAVTREKVPFPETLGSICNHARKSRCKRNELSAPLSVCRLRRATVVNESGTWEEHAHREAPTGRKAAIIGAGLTGLTAAYYLAKKGHGVTMFEKNEKTGSQCYYGIPAYQLPDELLDREIRTVLEAGFRYRTNTPIQAPVSPLQQGSDTVLVSVGTHKGTRLPLTGNDLSQVYLNTDFLRQARTGSPLPVNGRMMILGGGNAAYDCARTAVRLGAREVHITCLENERQMTSAPEEIAEGTQEEIIFHAAHSLLQVTGTDKMERVELRKVQQFYFDENRKTVIRLEEGTRRIVPADYAIFAVGQKPGGIEDMGLELAHDPYILTDADLHTSIETVYAAGGAATGTKSVIATIAAGRRAAEQMDLYLGGDGDTSEKLLEKEVPAAHIGRIGDFAGLKHQEPGTEPSSRHIQGFKGTEHSFTCEQTMHEAGGCPQCDLRLQLARSKLWNECQGGKGDDYIGKNSEPERE